MLSATDDEASAPSGAEEVPRPAFHAWLQDVRAAGAPTREWGPAVDPAHLAGLLRDMHRTKGEPEASYPSRL
jgi:hypothetical protein